MLHGSNEVLNVKRMVLANKENVINNIVYYKK